MRVLIVGGLTVFSLLSLACPGRDPPPPPVVDAGPTGDREVQILAINDFHGALDQGPPGGDPGAAALAANLAAARTATTITVSGGDNVGGSPLESALFHDEPTIDALNAMHLALSAVGNHEY